MPKNKQILLDNRPQGEASAANFKLVTTDTPALQDKQVLVRHHFLSLDPYMRGRMNEGKSYAQPQPLDQVMIGGTAAVFGIARPLIFDPLPYANADKVGAFWNPGWWREEEYTYLRDKFGAPGDTAQAYVLAHEVGRRPDRR